MPKRATTKISTVLGYHVVLAMLFFFFYLGFYSGQDCFTHFEPSQLLGGAKWEIPREKPPDHPQAERGLSHVTKAGLEPTAER